MIIRTTRYFLLKTIGKIYNIITKKPCLYTLKRQGLRFGTNINVQFNSSIDISHCWLMSIGTDVTLAPGAIILAHDASTKNFLNYTKIGAVEIGDRVFIGANAVILPGNRIGNDVIIGAGAIVTKDIPDNTVVAGNPAKAICKTSEYINKISKIPNQYIFSQDYTLNKITKQQQKEMQQKLLKHNGLIRKNVLLYTHECQQNIY